MKTGLKKCVLLLLQIFVLIYGLFATYIKINDSVYEFQLESTHQFSSIGILALAIYVLHLQGQVSDSTEGLSREELGRLVASRWTQENAAEGNDEVNTAKEEGHEHDEDIPEENHDGYNSDSDEDHKFEDDDLEDDLDTESGEDHEDPTGAYSSDEDDKTDYSGFSF